MACFVCSVTPQPGFVATRLGKVDDPIASCSNCDCFICGHHGHRDPGSPHPFFMCVMCDTNLVASSAAVSAGPTTITLNELALLDPRIRIGVEFVLVESFDDFKARRPNYPEGIWDKASRSYIEGIDPQISDEGYDDLKATIEQLNEDPLARRLMRIADLIVRLYEIPDRCIAAPLLRTLHGILWVED